MTDETTAPTAEQAAPTERQTTTPDVVDQSTPQPAATPAPEATPVATATEPAPAQPAAEASVAPAPVAPAPAAQATAAASADDGAKPSERIRIGTQRVEGSAEALEPKPVTPVTEADPSAPKPSQQKAYPPPNVRSQLSAEEQSELDAAMAGSDLDSIAAEAAGAAGKTIEDDTRVTGTVARIHGDDIFVELGKPTQGVLPLKQFEGKEAPTEGQQVEVRVIRLKEDDGLYELSLPSAPQEVGNWDEVSEGQVVNVTITGHNKGGLECKVSGIRGFMPMGQISLYRVENAEEYVGQTIAAVITEANRSRKNLVLSHKSIMQRERAEKRDQLLAELAPGQMREGIVRSLRDFGAFVDLGGVDGLVHVSKLSWERVGHPKEVLTEGQTIKVKVEKVDPETGKIALSYREAAENPWDKAEQNYPVGDVAKGKVSKIMEFGAFVRLEPGIEGMIHISELTHGRVGRVNDAVSEGQDVEAKILSVDRNKQRIALSLKALTAAPAREKRPEEPPEPPPSPEEIARKKKRDAKLKGGIGGPSGGEKFGLKW
ncbi:30S ribosomal protein S1 [Pseudobythopirellula maris]|uniref:30S ribosomal protein S1 n=1 Tax=Pseudobythopirellula maris TaxID=2527991 RepID=A0A5C5ZPW3_9BACT|nr:S1 RNA-binding domain-containing protein [Pseudobythopirellula maris]TWT88841.1 30S ribosomal protein S1 [Pseudobythopirellula maris]